MKNKTIGFLIVFVALMVGLIIISFNMALVEIVSTTCTHGSECPMFGTIDFQTNVSIILMVMIIGFGIYLIVFGDKISTNNKESKLPSKYDYSDAMKEMNKDEKLVFEMLIEEKGTMFQSDIVEKSGFQKTKVTRILDRFEGRRLVERKRRGMANVVILK